MDVSLKSTPEVSSFAKFGLVAKGIVYLLLGIFAFMAAFHLGGQSPGNTDKRGVFNFIQEQTGGQILLGLVALGLASYAIWRFIQAFKDTEHKGKDAKALAVRGRYLFSGLVYGSLTVIVVRMLFFSSDNSGNSGNESMARELLSQPFGQILAGIVALIFIGVGIYQVYYGLSEKFKKHVNKAVPSNGRKYMMAAGKIGYVARGIVWLIIGWLFVKAALEANASKAGDTEDAFQFLATASYGSYILGAVGLGLCFYGLFNFIRARYERFKG